MISSEVPMGLTRESLFQEYGSWEKDARISQNHMLGCSFLFADANCDNACHCMIPLYTRK